MEWGREVSEGVLQGAPEGRKNSEAGLPSVRCVCFVFVFWWFAKCTALILYSAAWFCFGSIEVQMFALARILVRFVIIYCQRVPMVT